jgi:hypothetical protein
MGAKSSVIDAQDLDLAAAPWHGKAGTPATLILKELERQYVTQVLNE